MSTSQRRFKLPASHGNSTHNLKLETTETAVMEKAEVGTALLSQLKE